MNFTNAIPGTNGQPQPADTGGGLSAFGTADTAPEFTPVPGGIYTARVHSGAVCTTQAGADAYRIRFEIAGGEQAGRTVVRTWTFGSKALPYTQRDLAPFGLTTPADLLAPFPPAGKEYRVRLVVALQRGNDGIERNDIKRIELSLVTDTPDADFLLPNRGEGGHK